MKIGIVGSEGVVGSAVAYGMQKLGHDVKKHDIVLDSELEDILDTSLTYICVPTPSLPSGKCDTSIVEDIVKQIVNLDYNGIIAIKSTVEPGTTERLMKETGSSFICFVPEFLRERCAVSDFTEDHDICVIGSSGRYYDLMFNVVKESHGHYPTEFINMSPTEAELSKYFNNIYNAALVTFANSFYEVCKIYGADYSKIKNAMVKRPHIHDMYIDCNENFRGFGGMCITPDTKVYIRGGYKLAKDIDIGDRVLTIDGSYQSITNIFERQLKEELLEIRCQGLDKFKITKNHPIYSIKANRKIMKNGKLSNYMKDTYNFEWNDAGQLSKGDFVMMPKPEEGLAYLPPRRFIKEGEDLFRLFGYYVAEGSASDSDHNRVVLAFHSNETQYHGDVKRILNIYGIKMNTQIIDNKCNLRFSDKELKELLLKMCGKYSHRKKLHNDIMWASDDQLKEFIIGYFRGDGSKSTDIYSMTTVSEVLHYQLKLILLRLGVAFTTQIHDAYTGKDGTKHRKSYTIRIRDIKAIRLFGEIINDPIDKEVKLERKTSWFNDDEFIIPIKSIDDINYEGTVYNFEVEDNHTYVVNDCVVHNCLPKDTKAIDFACQSESNLVYFSMLLEQNSKYKTTVLKGMRKE